MFIFGFLKIESLSWLKKKLNLLRCFIGSDLFKEPLVNFMKLNDFSMKLLVMFGDPKKGGFICTICRLFVVSSFNRFDWDWYPIDRWGNWGMQHNKKRATQKNVTRNEANFLVEWNFAHGLPITSTRYRIRTTTKGIHLIVCRGRHSYYMIPIFYCQYGKKISHTVRQYEYSMLLIRLNIGCILIEIKHIIAIPYSRGKNNARNNCGCRA